MRTEDDLRAAFRALERHTPDAVDVLRAVYGHSQGSARSRRLSARLPRRRALHMGLVVSAAVAVTAVAVMVALAHGPVSSGGPAAAPVLRARLLAAIDGARGDILFASGQSSDAGMWASPWYPRPGQRVRVHVLGFNADGAPAKDAEYIFTVPAGRGAASHSSDPIDWGGLNVSGTVLLVDHARRAWGEWSHQNITLGLPVNAAGIRSEIAKGRLKVIGRTVLRGHRAVELGITLSSGNGADLHVTTAHLWVDATTYLPMRQLLRFSDGKRDVTDYTFLQPTAANLAKLRPVIPADYKRVAGGPAAFHHPKQKTKK